MTKPRNPDSVAYAVLEAVRLLGADQCSKVIGRNAQTIRDYSDDERPGNITLEHAMMLDKACQAKSGEMPFLRLACLRAGVEPPSGEMISPRYRYEILPHRSRFVVVDNRSDEPAPVFQSKGEAERWIDGRVEGVAA
jgi:hypothetical protein